ncbi:hypothetical protein Tco_1093709, partial [Tanacetum coccineum]
MVQKGLYVKKNVHQFHAALVADRVYDFVEMVDNSYFDHLLIEWQGKGKNGVEDERSGVPHRSVIVMAKSESTDETSKGLAENQESRRRQHPSPPSGSLPQQIAAIRETQTQSAYCYRMKGPEPVTPLNEPRYEGASGQNNTNRSVKEGYLSALRELLKEPSNQEVVKKKGKEKAVTADPKDKEKAVVADEDLSKPFKEVLKCPRRIIEFSTPGYRMPINAKIYDGMGDPEDHISRFTGMGNQGEWLMPVSHKCLELSKRFSDIIPKTVDKILKRVDDYVRLEEAFRDTKLPKGEFLRNEVLGQWGQKNDRPHRGPCATQDRKRKSMMTDEDWMNVSITFPHVRARDLSEEAIMVEAEIEGKADINTNNGVRVFWRAGQIIRKNRVGCVFCGRRSLQKSNNEVHNYLSPFTLQYNLRRVGKKQVEEPAEKEKPQEKNRSNGR